MTKPPTLPDQPPRSAHGREGGFVLITVLFLAAAIAISLAVTLPRAAMQAQRLREERLIYRGEQYKRAIALYFRAHKKYPEEIDDLEETNGVRFLRRPYKDPLNENDEWRFIHMGADGRFKDSLIHDLEDPEEEGMSGSPGSGGIGGGRTGSSPGATNPLQAYVGTHQTPYAQTPYTVPDGSFRGADRARNVRESAAPEVVGQGQLPGWIPGQTAPNPEPQLDQNGNPVPPQGQNPDPNQQGRYPGNARMRPGQMPPNQLGPGYPGSQFGNQRNRNPRGPNQVGGAAAGSGGIANPRGQAGGFGQGGSFGQGARTQGAGSQAGSFQGAGGQAADVIRGILTSPRPGGLAGVQNNRRASGSGSSFKGGIAGVATKKQEMGVKVYEGYEMYNEWEFVYDYRKDDRFGGAAAGPGGGMGAGMAGPAGALPAGQPGMGPSGTLGGMPGTPASGAYPPGYPAGAPPGPEPQNPYGAIPTSGPGVQQIPQQGFGQRGVQQGAPRQMQGFPGGLPPGPTPEGQQPAAPAPRRRR